LQRIYPRGEGRLSYHTYIASDTPIQNIENPYIQLLSVNQALKQGITVPSLLLNSGINRDEPNVILWTENEENLGEITIHESDKAAWIGSKYPIATAMTFCSVLEWVYTEERAKELVVYIQKHLDVSEAIEIWRVWDGNLENGHTRKQFCIQQNDFNPSDLKDMFLSNDFSEYKIIIRRGKRGCYEAI